MTADGATVSIQVGNVPKHLHPNTNEIQYILDGTGTIWLGDKEVTVKPGDLVIIPKGTRHGGTKPISGQVKAIAIKTRRRRPTTSSYWIGLLRDQGLAPMRGPCSYPRPSDAVGRHTNSLRSTSVTP